MRELRPISKCILLISALALFLFAFPARAIPPDPETVRRELFEASVAHVKHKRYELALSAAKAALVIRRDRETLCNAGLIASRIDRFVESAEFLRECIELATNPSNDKEELERRLTHAAAFAMARTHIGTLRIVAPPLATIFVEHRKIGTAPLDHEVFVPANQNIEILADNFDGKGSERVTIAPGQSKTVVVRTRSVPKPLVSKLPEPKTPSPATPPPMETPSLFSSSLLFRVSVIGTLTALGASGSFLVASELDIASHREQISAARRRYGCGCACSVEPECTEAEGLLERAHNFRTLAIASGISAGIGLGITIALGKYLPVRASSRGIGVAF